MRKSILGWGFLLGALLSAPLTALMYLGKQLFDLNFPPFDIFNWATRLMPGTVVTFGIDAMVSVLHFLGINVAQTAKFAEQIIALSSFLLLAVLVGAVFTIIINWQAGQPKATYGLLAGALFSLPVITISIREGNSSLPPIINITWLLALFVAWGIILAWSTSKLLSIQTTQPDETVQVHQVQRISRREFLITLGAVSASITVVGSGVATILARGIDQPLQEETEEGFNEGESQQTRQLPNDDDLVTPAPGTRPEYTPVEDHYTVNIQLEPTVIDADTWQLPITGMVDNALMLSLDDIRDNYPPREQYVTLNCISGRIPTTLISTTLWTGVSLQDILADAQVQPGARYLQIKSADGFYESVSLNMINSDERIMLCYAFDSKPLPVKNGFPVRIWIPDLFGMKQPKWITSIEVTDEYKEGYWVQRGWDEIARVRTRSAIDTVAVDAIYENDNGQLMVPIGGIAFAGARGISKVEVNTGGTDWVEAQLRAPLSDTTWVIWHYDWPFKEGKHIFKVRCYEGDGTLQITESAPPHPSGATGIHLVQEDL